VEINSYNDHVRLLSPEPVGWLSTTNFTRESEPTLSWNQLQAEMLDEKIPRLSNIEQRGVAEDPKLTQARKCQGKELTRFFPLCAAGSSGGAAGGNRCATEFVLWRNVAHDGPRTARRLA